MERNLTLIGAMLLIMVIIFISAFHTYTYKNTVHLSNTAQLTTETKSSLSESNISVDGVYLANDRKNAFVAFSTTNTTVMSSDAKDFSCYISSLAKDPVSNIKSIGLFSFGISGKYGLYIHGKAPFESGMLQITLSNDTYKSKKTQNADKNSPATRDTFTFVINPGAKKAETAEFLNTDKQTTIQDLYAQTAGTADEDLHRQTLEADIEKLSDDLDSISKHEKQMQTYGLMLPGMTANADGTVPLIPRPAAIINDRVVTLSDGKQVLQSSTNVPGGTNFNWQSKRIRDGYLKDITGSDDVTVWNSYLSQLKTDGAQSSKDAIDVPTTYSSMQGQIFSTIDIDEDDAQVNLNNGADLQEIMKVINDYRQSIITYYEDKVQYEATDLTALLNLEYKAAFSATGFSSNPAMKVYILGK